MFDLTLDKETKSWLKDYYEHQHTILEYGSGGSTFLALESNPKTRLYCCETDRNWLANIVLESVEEGVSDRLVPIHLDVGPTGEWGYPTNKNQNMSELFEKISSVTWVHLDKDDVSPDVVFIDGRWRKGCFLTSILNCSQPYTVIWDDYFDRPHYHVFDDIIKPTKKVGRTAIFEINPEDYDKPAIHKRYSFVYEDVR